MPKRRFYLFGVLIFSVVASLLFLDVSGKAYAESSGTLGCLAKHNIRGNGVEAVNTRLRVVNYNDIRTIIVTRIRIFDGDTGAVLFDSGASGFPSTFNTNIGPYQASALRSDDVIAPQTASQLPVIIDWESAGKGQAHPLHGWAEHRVREISTGLDKSRTNYECSAL